ncbi:hypothetical protein POVWA2_097040 [Plasmodium ovale wallikeri]|uniref:Uncharacterized protein n=1 Tax=Plasmodium ovale wallikeri TaxID=864142 RepID=A0A1A9AT78_PLAOA|nr:hypothetical protein POVWA2_097040 [Plasmodium ovale wallikeri]
MFAQCGIVNVYMHICPHTHDYLFLYTHENTRLKRTPTHSSQPTGLQKKKKKKKKNIDECLNSRRFNCAKGILPYKKATCRQIHNWYANSKEFNCAKRKHAHEAAFRRCFTQIDKY